MREIAIVNTCGIIDLYSNLLDPLAGNGHITVFSTKCETTGHSLGISFIRIPNDVASSRSKILNFVYAHYFNLGHKGFLHVIEDRVMIFNSPTAFMDEIERMMSAFSLKSWYNTVCDVCNYTFKQYNPRLAISPDSADVKDRYGKTLFFTTHANPFWSCFNYGIATFDDIRLDDRFSIPIYYIIEFLARRRNTKKENELYFMNSYPTIAEERNVFRLVEDYPEPEVSQKQYAEEGALFNSLNINHAVDSAVEPIMDSIHHLLTH